MLRLVSRMETARGCALLWIPVGWGWKLGIVILEPFVGGWDQQFFIGRFRKSE